MQDFTAFFVQWLSRNYPHSAAFVGEIALLQAMDYRPHSTAREVLDYLRIVDTFCAATPQDQHEGRDG